MNNNLVTCKECGKQVKQIHWSHLRNGCKGTIKDTKEYLEKYPNSITRKGKSTGHTLQLYIERYGEIEGQQRWDNYCKFQSHKNTFEYKQKKYGWTREQFDEYNSKRFNTRKNFIRRHGDIEGIKKWDEYCKLQSYVGVKLEYFIEKYGLNQGTEIYNQMIRNKSNSRSNLIRKYGEVLGILKYEDIQCKRNFTNTTYSKISQELFNSIDSYIGSDETFYKEKNYEYYIYLSTLDKTIYIDYFNLTKNKAIEFYGDYWHASNILYEENDIVKLPNNIRKTAKEIRENDLLRLKCLKEQHNIDTLVVWEYEYKKDKSLIINKCVEFMKNE